MAETNKGLTHLDPRGRARMVDVSAKDESVREAVAEGTIRMAPETLAAIEADALKKGDVLACARIAGIMAAKKTAELVPLCHAIPLHAVEVELVPRRDDAAVHCRARVKTRAPTGVEMEALLAVEIALLTIYDMCKAIDRGMCLSDIRLLEKRGGRSGEWRRAP